MKLKSYNGFINESHNFAGKSVEWYFPWYDYTKNPPEYDKTIASIFEFTKLNNAWRLSDYGGQGDCYSISIPRKSGTFGYETIYYLFRNGECKFMGETYIVDDWLDVERLRLQLTFSDRSKLENYKKILLATADTLATLYNPKVGTILSWPIQLKHFGAHNTIIDNMINLELLFWASKNGGSKNLYDIAVKHATTTMNNHFRKDYSCYHVVLYDSVTGKKIKGVTHQGLNDSSMWARGQSWAIYGFTMCYRETSDPKFLDIAQKAADVYLKNLPEDLIPKWDFNAPADAPKDASAACVTASGLIELSGFVKDKEKAAFYLQKAEKMLENLSTEKYQSREKNSAFLLHSTGNKPANGEIDASIIYADYYYIEALLRLKKINKTN